MSITDIGREGEELARIIIKEKWKCDDLFQADWLVTKNGVWYIVEVKHKAKFIPPPFEGHGLDIRQVKARMKFFEDTGIRCIFLVLDLDGNTYWQWLDILEQGKKHDTKNCVRIYPLQGFRCSPRIG